MGMQHISIKVSDNIAEDFNRSDIQMRENVELFINAQLKKIFSSERNADALRAILKRTDNETKKSGLTPAIADELLKDE